MAHREITLKYGERIAVEVGGELVHIFFEPQGAGDRKTKAYIDAPKGVSVNRPEFVPKGDRNRDRNIA